MHYFAHIISKFFWGWGTVTSQDPIPAGERYIRSPDPTPWHLRHLNRLSLDAFGDLISAPRWLKPSSPHSKNPGYVPGPGLRYSVDLQIQTYRPTEPVPLKYGKLATKYPRIYGFFIVYADSPRVTCMAACGYQHTDRSDRYSITTQRQKTIEKNLILEIT